MQHSGTFVHRDGRSYIGGKTNYFDNCESSNMDMKALCDMARQIGQNNLLKFYCSIVAPNDCNSLVALVIDDDVKCLVKFVDRNFVVGVFIDDFDQLHTMQSQVGSNSLAALSVDVPRNLMEEIDTQVGGGLKMIHKLVGGAENNANDMADLEFDSSSGSSEEESDDDNDYLCDDGFEESDFELDDEQFDENIDKEIEWVGIMDEKVSEKDKAIVESNTEWMIIQPSNTEKKSRKRNRFPDFSIYRGDADDSDFEFEIGMKFKNATEFREAVRIHSNKQGRPLDLHKNCKDKIQVRCKCGYVVYASYVSQVDKTFQVKSIKNQHTCTREPRSKHCTSKFLAKKYQHHIRSNPEWPVYSMQEIMQMENQTLLSISKMYRAKIHATKLINGSECEQYAKLWDYCEEIKRTNPNTTIKIKCKHVLGSGETMFKRFYICWGALKKGFLEGCRPVIGIDGTHLKTERGGVLLTAVGIDGNNNMFPIAYAMVLTEKRKTWDWFLGLLIDDLEIENSYSYTIISDKQKGLIKAVEELLPHAEHRFCVRHMYNNFQKKHKGG
ncbi:hypothetical protein ACJIZ3_008149 [Penstemon smallii]|uniref:MULE transposase domain-containing protein n=1 Tax=Penstemon smallii TaxID=265156 RepID=A0ABD3TAG8_9LAMI